MHILLQNRELDLWSFSGRKKQTSKQNKNSNQYSLSPVIIMSVNVVLDGFMIP